VLGLPGIAGLSCGRLVSLPYHGEVIASGEPVEVSGDEVLDPLQVFLIGGFGAQCQRARVGLHGALAPPEGDGPPGPGPFDLRAHVRMRGRVTGNVSALRAQQVSALVAEVPAELDEVPSRAFGLDVGLGNGHGIPFCGTPRGWPRGDARQGRAGVAAVSRVVRGGCALA